MDELYEKCLNIFNKAKGQKQYRVVRVHQYGMYEYPLLMTKREVEKERARYTDKCSFLAMEVKEAMV
jgi:hypothetical protein